MLPTSGWYLLINFLFCKKHCNKNYWKYYSKALYPTAYSKTSFTVNSGSVMHMVWADWEAALFGHRSLFGHKCSYLLKKVKYFNNITCKQTSGSEGTHWAELGQNRTYIKEIPCCSYVSSSNSTEVILKAVTGFHINICHGKAFHCSQHLWHRCDHTLSLTLQFSETCWVKTSK